MMEMRKETDRDGGASYIVFTKNRNGVVDDKSYFELSNSTITYSRA